MVRSAGVAVGIAGLAVLVTGCQRGEEQYAHVPPVPSPPVSASPRPTGDQEIVDRYLAYVRALEKLYETTDPAAVDMSAVATGVQLRNDVERALTMKGDGVIVRGQFDNRIAVKSVEAGKAMLENCQGIGTATTVRVGGGVPTAGPVDPPRLMLRVELGRDSGSWKVARIAIAGEC
jgi:hypothetical protein